MMSYVNSTLRVLAVAVVVSIAIVGCGANDVAEEPVTDPAEDEVLEEPEEAVDEPDDTVDESDAGDEEADDFPRTTLTATFPSESITDIAHLAAMERGYYEDENLDVTFEYGPPSVGVSAVLGGEFDFSAAASGPALVAWLQGGPIQVIMGAYDVLPFELWSQPEISSVEELRGQSIAIEGPGTTSEAVVVTILEDHGLSPADVDLVSVGGVPNWFGSLQGGTASAAILSNGIVQRMGENAGFNKLAEGPDHLDGYLSGLATTTRTLEEKEEAVRRYVRATLRGFDDYMTDEQFGVELLLGIAPPDFTEEDARAVYERDITMRPDDLVLPEETVQSMATLLAELEGLDAPADVSDLLDWRFIEEARGR